MPDVRRVVSVAVGFSMVWALTAVTARAQPPANDLCASAQQVGEGAFAFTNVNATVDIDSESSASCGNATGPDVWFEYTPTATGVATIDTCAAGRTVDTVVSAYATCIGGAELGCNDDDCGNGSRVRLLVVTGRKVFIRVAGHNGATGTGTLTIAIRANANCTGAAAVGVGAHAVDTRTTTNGGTSSCNAGASTGADQWFKFTPNRTGVATFDTCAGGRTFDTVISVFNDCGGFEIGCNDDDCGQGSRVLAPVGFGRPVYVRVAGAGGATGTATLTIALEAGTTLPAPPTVNQGAIPENHRSYVRSANRQFAATDRQYVQDVRNLWPTRTVDSVFDQCYSGGFVARIASDAAAPPGGKAFTSFTAASATSYDQTSESCILYSRPIVMLAGVPTYRFRFRGADDFARAWTEDARRNPMSRTGYYRLALTGALGRSASDALGVVSVAAPNVASAASTQYYAPDPNVGNVLTLPNNGRHPIHTPANPVYAIIVAWSRFTSAAQADIPVPVPPPAARPRAPNSILEHGIAASVTRMYRTLRDRYGVPVGNIVVLYEGSARGQRVPLFTTITPRDGDGTIPDYTSGEGQGVFIDGPNTRNEWLAALRGDLFADASGTSRRNGGTNVPPAGARLFIYNTGHGGQARLGDVRRRFGNVGTLSYITGPDAFDKSPAGEPVPTGEPDEFAEMAGGTTDEVEIQVSTSAPIPGARVRIDDHPQPVSLLPVAPEDRLAIDEFVPDQDLLFHYRAVFPASHFNPNDPRVRLEIIDAPNPDPANALLRAVILSSGRAEYLATVVAGCPLDVNGDGVIDPDDLGDFITCYFTKVTSAGDCPSADYNGDYAVDPDDLGDFINDYFSFACQ